MSIKKKHYGYVNEQGILSLDDIVSFKQDLLNHRDKKVSIVIERKRKYRSGNENRYAHAVVFPMVGEAMGCSPDEAKDALKWEFLRFQLPSGIWTVKQTSNLSTVEFEDFMSKCRMLASQVLDTYIPTPNEVSF